MNKMQLMIKLCKKIIKPLASISIHMCSFVRCMRVCAHLGIRHSASERHSCPVPSVSVVAGSG